MQPHAEHSMPRGRSNPNAGVTTSIGCGEDARVRQKQARFGEGPRWIRLFLVLSSMSPLFVLWAIRGTALLPAWLFLVICGALFLAPNAYLLLLIGRAHRHQIQRTIEVGEADDRRQDIIPYLFAMLLPFYAVDLSTGRAFAATIAAFVIVVVLFTSLNLHYMNLLVAVFGYHCFQVSPPDADSTPSGAPTFMVITRRSRLRPGSRLTGYLVSPTVLVEKRE